MVIICDSCGRENEDEFKFCLGCGSALSPPKEEKEEAQPEMVDCPHCGGHVPSGFKFCGQCGGSLDDVAKKQDTGGASVQSAQTVQAGSESAAAAAEAQRLGELTVIRPDGTEGARIPLTSDGLTLGRDSEFDVLADDPFLSPQHAEIRHRDGTLMLRDLDSVNGVFWRLRDDVELQDGDLLRVGQELLRFEQYSRLDTVGELNGANDVDLQGSPDPGIWGRLSLIGGPGVETRAFAIAGDEATIGREVGTVLFGDDGFVSGKHARVYLDDGKVFFRDLGSSNGSYIRIRKERQLSNGDLVLMGQQLLRVTIG